MKKNHLTLIKNEIDHSERIQNRIEAFRQDILAGDGSMEYVEQILAAIHDYMIEFEDEDVIMSAFKVKEACFYVNNFLIY